MEQKMTHANLLELLAKNKKELDAFALSFLPVNNQTPEISELYDMMRDYPSRGGKGLRGSLCLLWCQLFGGRRNDALVTAAALELFQNWILIHDDIEDESDLRRGKPALHKKHGVALSINAGDALHGKMWELLVTNRERLGNSVALQILGEFATMLDQTTEGQHMELSWNTSDKWSITEADYLTMVTKKSAWYTCISPARLGVILASAFRPEIKTRDDVFQELVQMGTDIGIAFQIVDDLLNLTASQEKYGKEILGDIFEGKRTLMLIYLLANCSQDERKEVVSMLSKPRQLKTEAEAKAILELMKQKRSTEYASEVAQRYARRGLEAYDSICRSNGLESSSYYETTRLLLEYMIKRDY